MATALEARSELYRLLGEPSRVRLLALAADEELTVGELAQALDDSAPNVSRHVKALRGAGLLSVRRQATRALVRLHPEAPDDPVVADALAAGRASCAADGSLTRATRIIAARDAASVAFFEAPMPAHELRGVGAEVPAYLGALALLLPRHRLAVDAGTGDGALLDLLAPIFDRVIGVDRSPAQLERAAARLHARGYDHVELHAGSYDDEALAKRVRAAGLADVVFASRVLHHAARPAAAMRALADLAAPGGAVVVLDYAAHDDERLREQQADVWLGFEADELVSFARAAGLDDCVVRSIPAGWRGDGPDSHLEWQAFVARRPCG
jgi:ArsR family transcriptional regulator